MSAEGRNSRTSVALGVLSTIIVAAAIPSLWIRLHGAEVAPASPAAKDEPHRSPIALALSSDGTRLLVANQTAGSISLVDTASGKVLHELATGDKPAGVAISSDGTRGVVTHRFGYDLALLKIDRDRMTITGRVEAGPKPRGVVLDQGGKTAFVAVGAANEIARVDLETMRVAVGREPRGLALSPDGSILLVGNARSQEVSVISTQSLGVFRTIPIEGDNLRQVAISADGRRGYIANMKNRGFATTANNIDLGWVLGQRLTRVDLDTAEPSFATLSLDPRGKAAADAHGVAVSKNNKFLAVSLGGTHEVMIFRTDGRRLPWRVSGSRDLIPAELLGGDGRYRRVPLGGRPTELGFALDDKTLFVANYLADAVQVVDAESARLIRTIPLGSPSTLSLARRGEILFHAAERSFNQWYSCNTCHSDGHTNGLSFDTLNDGRQDLSTAHLRSHKKVPTLRRVTSTGPWTWHGWQTGIEDAMLESFIKSMEGPRPSSEDIKALIAYLGTLEYPRNPYTDPSGRLSPEAERGKVVYRSAKASGWSAGVGKGGVIPMRPQNRCKRPAWSLISAM
ncbi:MAG TPA: hypothetical protein VKF17_12500 [Isosphaeraceae bacterium]|nr:hypothetical protein [Isosphaeraceae bacterium]